MTNKQILKVKSGHNDEIVKIAYSHTTYLDENFFKRQMDEILSTEDKKVKKFPVRLFALKIDWLL